MSIDNLWIYPILDLRVLIDLGLALLSVLSLWKHPSLDLRLIGCVSIDLGLAPRANSLWIHTSLDLRSNLSKPQLDLKEHHIQCLEET